MTRSTQPRFPRTGRPMQSLKASRGQTQWEELTSGRLKKNVVKIESGVSNACFPN